MSGYRVESMPNPVAGPCPYCSAVGMGVFHSGICPKIKAIEYTPWGAIKRIEFRGEPTPKDETP